MKYYQHYNLMFGCLGNGVTVCDRSREEHGDYKHIAHIDPCGAVMFYEQSTPPEIRQQVFNHATALAADFRDMFLRQRKHEALSALNNRLNIGQFLSVFCQDNIAEKSMEDIYAAYIKAVCAGGRRTMP